MLKIAEIHDALLLLHVSISFMKSNRQLYKTFYDWILSLKLLLQGSFRNGEYSGFHGFKVIFILTAQRFKLCHQYRIIGLRLFGAHAELILNKGIHMFTSFPHVVPSLSR